MKKMEQENSEMNFLNNDLAKRDQLKNLYVFLDTDKPDHFSGISPRNFDKDLNYSMTKIDDFEYDCYSIRVHSEYNSKVKPYSNENSDFKDKKFKSK